MNRFRSKLVIAGITESQPLNEARPEAAQEPERAEEW